MRRLLVTSAVAVVVWWFTPAVFAAPSISISPNMPIQGEPIMVTVDGAAVRKLMFAGKPLNVFSYQSKPTAFIGVDLNARPGTYWLEATVSNGEILKHPITIYERPKIKAPLGIPDKLGGNNPASEKSLVTSITNENAILSNLKTNRKALWKEKFRLPVENAIVSDEYGYTRQTGAYTIPHKGTDFGARIGTPVLAMNRGAVRLVREFRAYGKMIAIDHGLGVMTYYLHLSRVDVNEGDIVLPGQVIGLSGDTGYAVDPHLHLTVKVNNISVDPMKFMAFFK